MERVESFNTDRRSQIPPKLIFTLHVAGFVNFYFYLMTSLYFPKKRKMTSLYQLACLDSIYAVDLSIT